MTKSFGYRQGTRDAFSKHYKTNGRVSLTPFLVNYKAGDCVDIVVDGAEHRGMPHKNYNGKTGVVFTVTPRAVGVEVTKPVRNCILRKRIYVRVEHVRPSRSREEFAERKLAFAALKKENPSAKPVKRLPAQPKAAATVKPTEVKIHHPVAYIISEHV